MTVIQGRLNTKTTSSNWSKAVHPAFCACGWLAETERKLNFTAEIGKSVDEYKIKLITALLENGHMFQGFKKQD